MSFKSLVPADSNMVRPCHFEIQRTLLSDVVGCSKTFQNIAPRLAARGRRGGGYRHAGAALDLVDNANSCRSIPSGTYMAAIPAPNDDDYPLIDVSVASNSPKRAGQTGAPYRTAAATTGSEAARSASCCYMVGLCMVGEGD